MGKTLPQSSRKRSHKQHADATHLTRKRGVYYYRRLIPERLGTEVALSLGTRRYREAEHLAEQLDVTFNRVVHTVTNQADLRAILRAYLESALEDDTTMRLHAVQGRPIYGGVEYDNFDHVDVDLETVGMCLSDAEEALRERNFKSVESSVERLMKEHGLPESARKTLAYGVLEANVKLLEEVERRVRGEVPLIFLPEASADRASKPTTQQPAGPLFSEVLPKYIDLAVKDKGWRGQSKAQNEATFAMFEEVCGDLPVTAYTRRHTSDFYNSLRSLPALYSKDKRWRGRPLCEVVEAAEDHSAPRLTMKTIKRHFSALGGFFTYAKRHGLIEGENPAHGFEFPSSGRSNRGRRPWEGDKLAKLFNSPVWTGCHPVFRSQRGEKVIRDDKYWLPLLGLYHGNRLEEFAQLRREDVKASSGVTYLHIHGEGGRQIKNEQSERRVPLHPEIERLGFLDYVQEIAPQPNDMLFPELRPGGPDKKVGYYFTKWWTNYRKAVGVYEPGLDYHSFRHGVTTKLFAAQVPRDIVDELTGHEGEGTSQRVYKHDTPLPTLRDAISKVRWPEVAL